MVLRVYLTPGFIGALVIDLGTDVVDDLEDVSSEDLDDSFVGTFMKPSRVELNLIVFALEIIAIFLQFSALTQSSSIKDLYSLFTFITYALNKVRILLFRYVILY